MVCEIIVSSVCQNLTRLSLWVTPIDAKWLQRLITSFPLLEHLYLGGCMLQEVIKLSSQSLKEICFKDCMKLVEAEFDTPKLQSFKYGGETIPRFYLNSVADYRTAEFSALFQHMDSLWFMRLYDILRYFKIQDLTFEIYSIGEDISFNAEDYTGKQFPLFELNNMKLVMFLFETTSTINYISLLDGLFWNLRPRILSFFKLYCLSPQNLKGLLKCLVAEEPNCYCSQNLDCWRHSLKDIKLITVKGWESDTVFNAMTLNDLTNYLDDWVIEAKEPLKYPVKNPLNCHGAKLFRLFYVVSVPVPKALCQPVLLPS
uniref:At1g61320/AtMIF1 LRR domain-containing protein n=3 Tax=Chenopodium quinoa TaxID=63459 RepID=A0A803N7X0_CHEQI